MKRSTPDPEIACLHYDKGGRHIYRCDFYHKSLPEVLGKPPIEKEQATLRPPLHCTHALFHKENSLGAPGSFRDLVRCQGHGMSRIDQVRRDVQVNVEKDNENGIKALQALARDEDLSVNRHLQ